MTCLQGRFRLGHEQCAAARTWSTTHSYGSPPVPMQRPHSDCSVHPHPDHFDGTATLCETTAVAGSGAKASTCSTSHTPADASSLMIATVPLGCGDVLCGHAG